MTIPTEEAEVPVKFMGQYHRKTGVQYPKDHAEVYLVNDPRLLTFFRVAPKGEYLLLFFKDEYFIWNRFDPNWDGRSLRQMLQKLSRPSLGPQPK